MSTAKPRVVLVGGATAVTAALGEALARRGVASSSAALSEMSAVVAATAPDLIVALDEAAQDSGTEVIAELGQSPRTSVIPVALVKDEPELDARLSAFRHGVCAVIRRQASVDAVAEEVARVVREVPERPGPGSGTVGEVTLEELVGTLSKQLRTGILSVRPRGAGPQRGVRLVLGAGRPISELIDDFVRRLSGHVVSAEPLEYEFDERALGTLELLDGAEAGALPERSDIRDLRILLADDDPARSDAVAQELRRAGAVVMVTDLSPSAARFTRLRELDPAVLMVGKAQLEGSGYDLVQRLRADLRFGWASLLVVDWAEVWPEHSAAVNVDRLLVTLAKLGEPERDLTERVHAGGSFEARLESTGPARLLRALVRTQQSLRIDVSSPRAACQIDLSEGLVVGATGSGVNPEGRQEGPAALALLLSLTTGRVRVEPVEQPAAANLMATVDVALEMAMAETSASPPSRARADGEPEHRGLPRQRRHGTGPVLLTIGVMATLVLGGLIAWLGLSRDGSAGPKRGSTPAVASGAVSASSASARAVPERAPPHPSVAPSATVGATPSPTPVVALPNVGKAFCEGLLAEHPPGGERSWVRGTESQEALRSIMRGDKSGAKLWYCRALERNDGDVAAAAGLVRFLIGERDGPTAAYWAERALLVHPNEARLRGLLGDALALGGDDAGARKAWLQAAGIDAADAPAVRKLGGREGAGAERASRENRLPEAERLYRRVAILVPDDVAASLALTRVLLAQGEAKDAARWAERTLQVAPRNAMAWIMLGDALARAGDRNGARAAWTKAQSIAPSDPEVRHRMSQP